MMLIAYATGWVFGLALGFVLGLNYCRRRAAGVLASDGSRPE